jgi:hypothetical protein
MSYNDKNKDRESLNDELSKHIVFNEEYYMNKFDNDQLEKMWLLDERLELKYIKEITKIILSNNIKEFSHIEFLIKEWSKESISYSELNLWCNLSERINGNLNVSLEMRKLIENKKTELTIAKHQLEIYELKGVSTEAPTENPTIKTQTANYLFINELGIIDYLKNKYSDNIINDVDMAKILCQIMRYEKETEIKSMRSLIKNHRNEPNKVETDKAINEVKQIMTFHKLL